MGGKDGGWVGGRVEGREGEGGARAKPGNQLHCSFQ